MRNSFAAILFLLLASDAFAADFGCGRDTDRSGTVDSLCPGSDKDYDGYTEAQGDCDDTAFEIFPGRPDTTGCSAGSYRVCKADGTGYTACVSSATTPYCPQGDYTTTDGIDATTCKYISPSGSDTTGDGSYANPWKTPKKISRYDSGAVNPGAGDAVMILSGTYTETSTCSDANDCVLFLGYSDGTAEDPIWILGYPGTKPVFQGEFVLYEAQGYIIRDIEITQGSVQSPGFSASGTPANLDIAGLYIHDKEGVTANNHACLKVSQGGFNNHVHHNYVSDCTDPAFEEGKNGTGIYMNAQTTDTKIKYNNIVAGSEDMNACVHEKHLPYGDTDGEVIGNYCNLAGPGYQSSGGKNRTIQGNLWVGCDVAIYLAPAGGAAYWGGMTIENNTAVCDQFFYAKPQWGYDSTGAMPSTEECSCTYGTNCDASDLSPDTWTTSNIRYNIAKSSASTWVHIKIGEYESDITRTLINGKFAFASNGLYSTNSSTPTIPYFNSNNSCGTYCCSGGSDGTTYSGLSAIQAAGLETSSIVEDPSLASGTYVSANANMSTWGYRVPAVAATEKTTVNIRKSGRRVIRR